MRRVISRAARNTADALGEALRGPDRAGNSAADDRLRALASTAAAFTDQLVAPRTVEADSLDTDFTPLHQPELD